MATWQLPAPLYCVPRGTSYYNPDYLGQSGLNLFIPWYLFSDKDLKIRDIAEAELSSGEYDHMSDWINGGKAGSKGWGHQRYATLLVMYIYLEKGVFHRYKSKLHGNTKKVMSAFIEFHERSASDGLETKADSYKKIRTNMNRRLKQVPRQPYEMRLGVRYSKIMHLDQSSNTKRSHKYLDTFLLII